MVVSETLDDPLIKIKTRGARVVVRDRRAVGRAARAEAVTALALLRAPVQEVLDAAVQLLADLLPQVRAAVHLVDGAATRERSVPEVPLARDHLGVLLVLQDDDGRALGLLEVQGADLGAEDHALVRQIGDVLQAVLVREQELRLARDNERRLVEAQRISHVGSYDFELATNTNRWSDQLYRIYGREPQSFEATYEMFLSLLHPDDRERVLAVHEHALATLEPYEMEERVIWPDGQLRVLASWGEVVPDADGKPARMVGICWDITERRAIEEQLVREALHDRLTGLPNRALLMDRVTQALGAVRRHGRTLAVLFIDVDRFKVINDSLGHDAGDEVLVQVARRLQDTMRPGDTVSRFGGDEFVVLCEDLDHPAQALALATRVQEAIAAPVVVGEAELVITVSTGIALPSTPADDAGALLRDADSAMYRAKHDGRARSVLFAEAMRIEAMDRLDTETQLRRALSEDQLRVHYQPLLDLATGALVGMEALVRWEHPTRGLVLPTGFIAIAEETGLVVPLGEWVLERACEQLVSWHRDHPQHRGLSMAVNLSGVQIQRPDLAARIGAILRRTGVDPAAVELEITETVLMRDAEGTLAVLQDLKALGVRLSVDDFGTGYSSLSYLKRFPVDTLKIDRSFVDGLGREAEDCAIVEAIQGLAASLGMTTSAEGVEETVQLEVLRRLGCPRAQGYLFSRPKPAEELDEVLELS
jgi:diguanylate cyclase (GGDEF)-like protein/PAS domain S-box-containing protein